MMFTSEEKNELYKNVLKFLKKIGKAILIIALICLIATTFMFIIEGGQTLLFWLNNYNLVIFRCVTIITPVTLFACGVLFYKSSISIDSEKLLLISMIIIALLVIFILILIGCLGSDYQFEQESIFVSLSVLVISFMIAIVLH